MVATVPPKMVSGMIRPLQPAGAEPDGVADAGRAAVGPQRTGGAIAPPFSLKKTLNSFDADHYAMLARLGLTIVLGRR